MEIKFIILCFVVLFVRLHTAEEITNGKLYFFLYFDRFLKFLNLINFGLYTLNNEKHYFIF